MGKYRTREAYKLVQSINKKWQPRQTAIKDGKGKVIMDKEKTKKRWTEYCNELYTNVDQENKELLDELERISLPPREDDEDEILLEEVEWAIKHLKNNRSPGLDGITGEMIRAGGDELMKEMHVLCKQIWNEGKIPEWTK